MPELYLMTVTRNFQLATTTKAAQILANDMLSIYLNKRLHYVDKQIIIEESRAFLSEHPFRWTAQKIALVELGYSIYAACVLNNGKADIKEIMTYLEASFKVDLGITIGLI